MRALGLESGTFGPFMVPRRCVSLVASRAQRLNRIGSGVGLGSGHWESIEGRAGARGGARAGRPRWVRILAIKGGCSMETMSFKEPPHWDQCSISISNTRLRKPSLVVALRAGVRRSRRLPAVFVSSRAQLPLRGYWRGPARWERDAAWRPHVAEVRQTGMQCGRTRVSRLLPVATMDE